MEVLLIGIWGLYEEKKKEKILIYLTKLGCNEKNWLIEDLLQFPNVQLNATLQLWFMFGQIFKVW